jgi:hypothetical protein
MAALRAWAARALAAGAIISLLAACSGAQGGNGQVSWAKAALERNPDVDVIRVDRRAGTITVTLRNTGVTRVVAATEVIGTVPAPAGGAAAGPVNLIQAASAGQAPTEPEPMDVSASGSRASAESQAQAMVAPEAAAARAFSDDTMPPPSSAPSPPPPPPPAPKPGQRVLASGPGYSIVVTSKGRTRGASAGGETRVTDAPLERMSGPIVCDGSRLVHIDNRNLEFPGNAITATNGCEIHITNRRIAAGGIGILARDASVHVENSQIIGHRASIEALDGAQVYVETSTFEGPRRRLGHAAIHDLGDNTWE